MLFPGLRLTRVSHKCFRWIKLFLLMRNCTGCNSYNDIITPPISRVFCSVVIITKLLYRWIYTSESSSLCLKSSNILFYARLACAAFIYRIIMYCRQWRYSLRLTTSYKELLRPIVHILLSLDSIQYPVLIYSSKYCWFDASNT